MPEFFIPSNIDLEVLVKDERRSDFRRNLIYGFAYVLNHFYEYPQTPKGRDIFEKSGGGVPINMETLRKEIGNGPAKKTIATLLEKGMITILKGYVPALHISRQYILNESFTNWTVKEVSKPEPLKSKQVRSIPKSPSLQNNQLEFLQKWLDGKILVLDRSSADFFIHFFYNRLYFEFKSINTSYSGERKKEYIIKLLSLLNRRYLEVFKRVLSFEKNISNFSQSKTNSRFDNVLTRMIKPVRHFLICNGLPLIEIDLSASQPFFFIILLNEVKKFKKEQIKPSSTPTINHQYPNILQTTNLHHMLCTLGYLDFVKLDSEIDRFCSLFEIGDFYENLAYELNLISDPPYKGFSSRLKTKNSFIHLLFEKFEGRKKAFPNYQIFRKAFPLILEIMDTFKAETKNNLSVTLQKIESEMMLSKVAKRFSDEFPDAPIYSIHDALLTTEPFVTVLKEMIILELKNVTGITPSTKINKLIPDSLFDDLTATVQREMDHMKDKVRKKKKIINSDYQFFTLFENKVPKWNAEEVMTVSVWAQVKDNPKYKPIRTSISTNYKSDLQASSNSPLVPIFEEPLNNNFTSNQVLAKGYVVPPMFQFVEDDEEEREKE